MKFIDFFCLITSKYDFQSITSKARDSILKFEKHQMHQIRNILILRLCTHFFSEDTEKGLVEPEIKFSCFLAPKTWKSINKQQRYQQKRPILH